jgi:uncharacterized protein
VATIRVGDFEWDSVKAATNERKHGVSFIEAISVFLDPFALDLVDELHADRWIVIGRTGSQRTVLVVYAERESGAILRLISARPATPGERKAYEKQ